MTTATAGAVRTGAGSQPVPVSPVRLRRVIHSEWVKISSLRSTWYLLTFTMIGMVAVGAIASAVSAADWDSMSESRRATFSPVDVSLNGVALAQILIAVPGVLVVTGEYTTGMIRSSLAAVPRRLPLLWGKLVVSAALSFGTGLVGCLFSFFLGQALLGSHNTALGEPHALSSVLGAAFYLMTITVLATALGFILRATAGGIATVLGVLMVLPVIGNALPQSIQDGLLPYLPNNAGNAVYATHPYDSTLSGGAALITLCAWVAVATVTASVLLRRRDA